MLYIQLVVSLNLSGAESAIIWDNYVNTTDVDYLAPCIARPSAAMIQTMWNGHVLISLENELQQPVMFQYEWMNEWMNGWMNEWMNESINEWKWTNDIKWICILMFLQINSACTDLRKMGPNTACLMRANIACLEHRNWLFKFHGLSQGDWHTPHILIKFKACMPSLYTQQIKMGYMLFYNWFIWCWELEVHF